MTREEAIKTLMGYSHTPEERAALETLIPELRESEDERIRKAIIGIIKNSNIIDINVSEERMIAYLEKQKEQKPVERSREDNYIIGFVYALLNQIEWKDNWSMSKEECLRRLNNYIPQKLAEVKAEEICKVICGKCYRR